MLVNETVLDFPLVMCLTSATKGKIVKQGTVRREENSGKFGNVGTDLIREIWEGLGFYLWD